MQIIQILTTVSFGDAVSNDCLAIKRLLQSRGYKTAVYAENLDKRISDPDIRYFNKLRNVGKNDIIIYHLSTGTILNRKIKDLPGRKYVVYHNVTPPHFFIKYSGKLAKLCSKGVGEVKDLKDTFEGGCCDSQYNLDELRSYGFTCPLSVRPILIPFEDYKKEPDAEVVKKMKDGVKNILFVGRIAPNKCQQDLISMLYAYKKMYSDPVRLILAGNGLGMEKYVARLKCYADNLGLSADVVFTGQISFPAILAYYSTAHCFVCMSEHEGFCVPLAEAMCFDVPILAYDCCAVPGTLNGTGILLEDKDPAVAAANLHEILNNSSLREEIVKEQRERLSDFSYENVSELFMKQLEEFIGGES